MGDVKSKATLRFILPLMAGLLVGLGVMVSAAAAAPPFGAGTVFIADNFNNQVLRLTPGSSVPTPVGSGLSQPFGVAVNAAGELFIADSNNNQVIKISAAGVQSTVLTTGLDLPTAVAVDAAGDLFIADTNNNRVITISAAGAQTTVVSGLDQPSGVAVDTAGNLFIADSNNNQVIKISAAGVRSTVSTTGVALPFGVAADTAGNLFISDSGNNRLIRISAAGVQSTVATGLNNPLGIAIDAVGNVLVANASNNEVLRVSPGGAQSLVLAGLNVPTGVAVYAPPPTFSADTPPSAATVALTYSYSYKATTLVGEPSARFAIFSGALPPGLSLNPETGVLSGIPTRAGTYTFRLEALNVASARLGPASTITVAKATQILRFTSTPPPTPTAGGSYQLTTRGGGSGNPVTFSLAPSSTAGACTLSGTGVVRFNAPGSCVISANQLGNANYNAAAPISQTLTVAAELAATGALTGQPLLTAGILILVGITMLLTARRRGSHASLGK